MENQNRSVKQMHQRKTGKRGVDLKKRHYKIGDLTGRTFGRWRVIRRAIRPLASIHTHYECRCSCGKQKIVASTNLIRKVSLGCRDCANKARRGTYRYRMSVVFSRIKKASSVRNIPMTINHDYVLSLMDRQKWRCALTGIKLVVGYYDKEGRPMKSNASLDRIDSSKGYVPGNVQWVYLPINMMKWKLTQKEFIRLCNLISRRHCHGK